MLTATPATGRYFDHSAVVEVRSLSANGLELYCIRLTSGEMHDHPFRTGQGAYT